MSDKKIMDKPLYIIIFKDKTHFLGGTSYFKTIWLEIPNKPIKRIFYILPTGDNICLEGYEKYYHIVEATKDWMRVTKNKIEKLNNAPVIEYAYIMGKKGNEVTSYRITLINRKSDKFRLGDITVRKFNINDSKIKGLNIQGWK